MKLEIIAFNIESCKAAQDAGANRIELCASPGEGGTTPSHAFIEAARKILKIQLYVMIRPRGGDFLYNDDEINIMVNDAAFCRQVGCDGIVTGVLNENGTPDRKANEKIIKAAYPLGATFHRAFDRCNNPQESLDAIIQLGFERVLTSGQQPTALEGKSLLAELIKEKGNEIIIMPGSGINAENILEMARETGAQEFHSSASIAKESNMTYKNIRMNEDLEYITVNAMAVEAMAKKLSGFTV
ncbi:MAG: copper homeostasis protein CutC [Bacteroidetes bacterium]|nr:copper homeostasis protein CutC [Bacteroidota bacterium]